MLDECVHGMNPDWCGLCRGNDGRAQPVDRGGIFGGRTKQDELDLLCDQLGIPRTPVSRGSSLPSHVFDAVRTRFKLPAGSMPEVAEAAVRAAGLRWSSSFDSRATISRGGSTVTFEGIVQLNRAVTILLRRERGAGRR